MEILELKMIVMNEKSQWIGLRADWKGKRKESMNLKVGQ